MAIEHAAVQAVRKPWGVTDLRPWSDIDGAGSGHRTRSVAMGARGTKAQGHSPDASGSGVHIECLDLGGVSDSLARAAA